MAQICTSWHRAECQISHAMLFASGVGRYVSAGSDKPSVTSPTCSMIRVKLSRNSSRADAAATISVSVIPVTVRASYGHVDSRGDSA
ncbi:Uncharacterised protein [Mycobacteroides abscessus subsp. abscessus]|nr:Uncharacterised protein [Mycobacteroides abscessus subsp. abscessus]SHV81456.1 Uncharacterised protein [Mycobacteroides abscessus subsp. abscessus]